MSIERRAEVPAGRRRAGRGDRGDRPGRSQTERRNVFGRFREPLDLRLNAHFQPFPTRAAV